MKILVSSFEPFLEAKSNCSLQVTQELEKDEKNYDIYFAHGIPVRYKSAWENLKTHIDKQEPDVVLALGQAENSKAIALERWGLNWIESGAHDNDGLKIFGKEIDPSTPTALKTKVDIDSLYDNLQQLQVPVQTSVSAGGFLCNFLYYHLLLHHPKALFVHLPLATEQQDPCFASAHKLPLKTLCTAVQTIINSLR